MQDTVHTEGLARARISSSDSKSARERGRRRDGRRTGREEGQAALCVRVLLVLSAFCFGVCIYAAKRACARCRSSLSPHNSPVSNARTRSLAIAREPTSASMVRCDRSMRSVLLFLVSPEIPEQLSRKIRSFCKVPHELMTALATLTAALSPFSRRPASASRRCVPSSAAAVCSLLLSLPSLALAPSVLLCACAVSL